MYGRRPSDGSSAREAEGGSAASSNTQPTPTPHTPRQRPAKSSSKAKHTREQLDRVRAVRALYPPDLLHGWTSPDGSVSYEPLPDVPTLSQAILDALAGDVPAADRTVEQLGARIQQRWRDHGWADNFYAGAVTSLVGVAIDMVRPLKGSDRYGCANPRCDAGRDVDTGEPCVVCPERIAARKAARRQAAEPSAAPAAGAAAGAGRGVAVPGPREHRPFRECPCREPIPKDSEDTLCPACRRDADEAERDRQLREQLARQYGTPEQVAAYCGEPPF
ncbi:hypothetical protein [Streptomyces sp. NPDC101145]|uniref:hypothetical protein n=1 Tax=Streptomyces sp. NPDC101145 TaxID=3366112 RepID=UPI0038001CE1